MNQAGQLEWRKFRDVEIRHRCESYPEGPLWHKARVYAPYDVDMTVGVIFRNYLARTLCDCERIDLEVSLLDENA